MKGKRKRISFRLLHHEARLCHSLTREVGPHLITTFHLSIFLEAGVVGDDLEASEERKPVVHEGLQGSTVRRHLKRLSVLSGLKLGASKGIRCLLT